jgi:uncharacterized protein (UPF0264 family)
MKAARSPGLLVSVRSPVEAAAAIAGGAALIDVKEPAHGSLGRADAATIAGVIQGVAGRRPVSAALGELVDFHGTIPESLAFVKWGLAGCQHGLGWRSFFEKQWQRTRPPRAVVVAYADWQCAQAPPLDDVVAFTLEWPGNVLLVDTHCKDRHTLDKSRRPTLRDWVSVAEVVDLCQRCRGAGIRVALAGSLGREEIAMLKVAEPDWFAVRGAVCAGGSRGGAVEANRVRTIVELLAEPVTAAMCAC